MAHILLAILTLCLINHSYAQTLWTYDPDTWRATPNSRLNFGATRSINNVNLQDCKDYCLGDPINPQWWVNCSSITWDGNVDSTTDTGTCTLYRTRFGFPSGGFNLYDGLIGEGKTARLEFKGSTTYFEKPMDYQIDALIANYPDSAWGLQETLQHHLISNVIRLNKKGYKQYVQQTNDNPLDYDQYLMYYRDGQPGYVNNSADQLNNKYSVIVEVEDGVADAEECAKYCTRNRGVLDEELGTRCTSFNYNTDGSCHLLSFAMDGVGYNMDEDLLPRGAAEDVKSGWFYYEGLFGRGCWVVHGQCRKWNDASYQQEQAKVGRNGIEVGIDVGVIKVDARDPVCSKCSDWDVDREWEYVCLSQHQIYHEDRCDNDADKGTVAYWAQDGAPAAAIWNSWDFTEGCVIDLTTNPFDATQTYSCINGTENPRFSGKKFRDSIGEEEFAAGVDKKRCWERSNKWYNYCGIADQGIDGAETYLNVSWPSDGSWYLSPATPCSCDDYGMKIEETFGMKREYCTRPADQQFCYRPDQEDYYQELDVLCTDVVPAPDLPYNVQECDTSTVNGATGCYLYYPQPSNPELERNYVCRNGDNRYVDGEYWDDDLINNGYAKYRPIRCGSFDAAEDPCLDSVPDWTWENCLAFAETLHGLCGNTVESLEDTIIVWFRPTGQIGTYPPYRDPYKTTVVRGMKVATGYTESEDGAIIDMIPIRNGRWMEFIPNLSGKLRQITVYYQNTGDATLTMTLWYGSGITESIFLGQVSVYVPATTNDTTTREIFTPIYVGFPLPNVTVTSGETYTWQVTSVANSTDGSTELGDLGYVRGNGYSNGIGDLAWDYLFVAWIEGATDDLGQAQLGAIADITERPWFEIWCIMIIILFIIFLVFLCLLHWKRRYDEEQERKEDKKFQAELRQRAMLQAEAERNAKNGIVEDDDYDDYDEEDYEEDDRHGRDVEEEEYDNEDDQYIEDNETGGGTTKKTRKASNHLSPGGGGQDYKRVKSASRNDMAASSDDGGDGYQDPDETPKKKKRKKKKKPKKRQSPDDDGDDYQEFAD